MRRRSPTRRTRRHREWIQHFYLLGKSCDLILLDRYSGAKERNTTPVLTDSPPPPSSLEYFAFFPIQNSIQVWAAHCTTRRIELAVGGLAWALTDAFRPRPYTRPFPNKRSAKEKDFFRKKETMSAKWNSWVFLFLRDSACSPLPFASSVRKCAWRERRRQSQRQTRGGGGKFHKICFMKISLTC